MAKEKIYFQSMHELENNSILKEQAEKEFVNEVSTTDFLGNEENLEGNSTSRRDFLKFLGFSTAAATIAACETPVQHAIPYVIKPEEVIPGVANWYASSYFDGHEYASILVKTREGRPINIKGNTDAPYGTGLSPRVQGSVLSLYDSARLTAPMKNGVSTDWSSAMAEVKAKLDQFAGTEEKVVFMTSTLISPSSKKLIKEFKAKYPNFEHVAYDAVSHSAMLDANALSFGKRVMPTYRFDKAEVIVSLAADFLQDWTELDHRSQFAKTRNADSGMMSRHYQFESNMSLTGSNADFRYPVKASQQGMIAVAIYNAIAKKAGQSTLAVNLDSKLKSEIEKVANDLWAAKGKSLVVAGSSNVALQLMVNGINELLSNYGSTISVSKASYLKQGDDAVVNALIKDMKGGKVAAIMMHQVNPMYTLANNADFAAGLKKVKLSVSFSGKADETASACQYILPDNHFFESWNDAMPVDGFYSLSQPTISPLFDTKQWQDVFLAWMGSDMDFYSYIKNNWKANVLGLASWNTVLHDGFITSATEAKEMTFQADLNKYAQELKKEASSAKGLELTFYTKSGVGIGAQANNPWLQELPDPISRTSWDNYLTMSVADAKDGGFENPMQSNGGVNGSMAKLTVNGVEAIVPVLIQPGQKAGTLGLAFGYGRQNEGKAADGIGVSAYPFYQNFDMTQYNVSVELAEGEHEFAMVQVASTMMGRERIVRESTLEEFIANPKVSNTPMTLATHKGNEPISKVTLWENHERDVHFWNLSIDLTKCTGCAACVVACHAENNVPVVGKEEIRKSRDMHWLRIDRYYSSETTKESATPEKGYEGVGGAMDMFLEMEIPAEKPEVVFQPVMCQHCNNAPCETVCPVAATSHSKEGLNHMAYNRCVGTRYCANNCPYKVRRFNWFQYSDNDKFDFNMNDDLGKMVLNPDVVVRSRGVMEKCTMCVHRIQRGKLDAKKEGRLMKDGDVITACAAACDTGAMVFGDALNKDSELSKVKEGPRSYFLLEEIGTNPSVVYQTKVRNK